jgi:hypothetical protein
MTMNDKAMTFINNIQDQLGPKITDKSGAALYSSIKTIQPGKFLIIGLNPGGDPMKIKPSIRENLEAIKEEGFINEYCKTWYEDNKDKEHRLQKNMKELFRNAGYELNSICATNIIYHRTRSEKDLTKSDFKMYEQFLKELIKIVNPSILVTFGKRTYVELQNNFKSDLQSKEQYEDSGHGKWLIRYQEILLFGKKRLLIGFPHLSRYVIYNKPAKLKWFKEITNQYLDKL